MQELKKQTISNFIFVLQQQKKKLQYVERKSGSNKLINHHKEESICGKHNLHERPKKQTYR